jgi:hypothetical protein
MQSERRTSPAARRGPRIPKVDPKTGASHFVSDFYLRIARVRTEDGRSREAVTIRNLGTRGARTHARLRYEIIVPDAQASHRVQTYPRHERGEPGCSRRRTDVKGRVTNNQLTRPLHERWCWRCGSHTLPPHHIPSVQIGNGCEGKDASATRPPPSRIKADESVLRTRIAAKRRSRCSNNPGYSDRRGQRYTFLPRPIRSSA